MCAISTQYTTSPRCRPGRDSAHRRAYRSVLQSYLYRYVTARLVYTKVVCCSKHILTAPRIEEDDLRYGNRVAETVTLCPRAMYQSTEHARVTFCWYSTRTLELFHVVEWNIKQWLVIRRTCSIKVTGYVLKDRR